MTLFFILNILMYLGDQKMVYYLLSEAYMLNSFLTNLVVT